MRAPGITPIVSTRKIPQSMWPSRACTIVPGITRAEMITSDVPSARLSGIPRTVVRIGTMMMPPPTPRRPETSPAASPAIA